MGFSFKITCPLYSGFQITMPIKINDSLDFTKPKTY